MASDAALLAAALLSAAAADVVDSVVEEEEEDLAADVVPRVGAGLGEVGEEGEGLEVEVGLGGRKNRFAV